MRYRPEIDGLRGIAVLSVIFYHAFPGWVPGGFLGVDIFFVLSGFLISEIIIRELSQGSFSIFDFFGRRIRRIFPALIIVLFAVSVFGWYALLNSEYELLGKHVLGGVTFTSNFMLWNEATGYFTPEIEFKPLQHLWSLAVEEQFYVIWPLLLTLAAFRKYSLFTVMLFVAVISFGFIVLFHIENPILSFYWPIGRFWEFALGGMLSLVIFNGFSPRILSLVPIEQIQPLAAKIANKRTDMMSIAGLSLLLFSVFMFNSDFNSIMIWFILPVLGTLLLIAAGSEARASQLILMNPAIRWFGLISYPLYLWHWPLLSYLAILGGGEQPHLVKYIALLLAILLAWLTHILIENKFRFEIDKLISTTTCMIAIFALGIIGYAIIETEGMQGRFTKFYSENERIMSQIGSRAPLENDFCRNYYPQFTTGLCVLEEQSDPTVVLFGDSHALHLYEGLASGLSNQNLLMIGGGWGGRHKSAMNPISGDETGFRAQLLQMIDNTSSIHTVIIAHLINDDSSENYAETFQMLTAMGKDVVYIFDIPSLPFEPRACLTSPPLRIIDREGDRCSFSNDTFLNKHKKYRSNVLKALEEKPFVYLVDPSASICDDNACYAMLNEELLYSDQFHLSTAGSLYVGRHISAKLNKILSD